MLRKSWAALALAGLLVSSLLAVGCAAGPAGGAPTVRLAYFPNITHAIGLVGVQRGTIQRALGEANRLDVKSFNAGPALIEALLAGEIDIGYVGPNPAINGFVKSKGEALRIVAGASSGGALFVVRPESGIGAAKDLAGRTFASPQLGGTQDVALRYYLKQNGLKTDTEGGTVRIIPTANADILTLFKQGRIDGAWVPEPWAARLIQEGGGKVLVDERSLWPDGKFVTTLVVVSAKFLKARPDLVKQFLRAHVEAAQFVASDPAAAKKITNDEIARITSAGLPPAVIDQAFANVAFTWDPYPRTLLEAANAAFALGFLGDAKPDLTGIFDLTLLNEVLAEKGLAPVTDRAGSRQGP
jgi:NitT/TauT family transport system substrate-binding protein